MREHTPEGASQKRILSSWPAVARITLMVIEEVFVCRCDVERSCQSNTKYLSYHHVPSQQKVREVFEVQPAHVRTVVLDRVSLVGSP